MMGRFCPNKSVWASLHGNMRFFEEGAGRAESFGLKTLITHKLAQMIIAHFDNFLGYQYKKNCFVQDLGLLPANGSMQAPNVFQEQKKSVNFQKQLINT